MLRPEERPYFRETLAWARLDVDLEHGEALIEEVQNDPWQVGAATLPVHPTAAAILLHGDRKRAAHAR